MLVSASSPARTACSRLPDAAAVHVSASSAKLVICGLSPSLAASTARSAVSSASARRPRISSANASPTIIPTRYCPCPQTRETMIPRCRWPIASS